MTDEIGSLVKKLIEVAIMLIIYYIFEEIIAKSLSRGMSM